MIIDHRSACVFVLVSLFFWFGGDHAAGSKLGDNNNKHGATTSCSAHGIGHGSAGRGPAAAPGRLRARLAVAVRVVVVGFLPQQQARRPLQAPPGGAFRAMDFAPGDATAGEWLAA